MDDANEQNDFRERDLALEQIAKQLGVRAERGRRFAELTSLRVGGAIDWVLSPETEAQAAALVHAMDQGGIGWRALGSDTNSTRQARSRSRSKARMEKNDPCQ